ncbi:hypothetical protein FLP41_05145 [Paracoccus marcusii]|nr:hypothetical protein FLP41_05145 [Paracoccus marcusii]
MLLVTDSAEPSGVGAHMVALAAALAERGCARKRCGPTIRRAAPWLRRSQRRAAWPR